MFDRPMWLIQRERIVAPDEHLGVLIEPTVSDIAAMWRQPRPDAPIGDSTLAELRASLRRRLGIDGPIIATGHQAELFHAGVFAKNIAAAELAKRLGACGVFVSVDSDLPKSDQLRITRCTGGQLVIERVALPAIQTDMPVEAQRVADAHAWSRLFEQLRGAARDDSALDAYADGYLSAIRRSGSLAIAHAAGQSAVEQALGVAPLRVVRMSELAATTEFAAFARHWVSSAIPFAEHYNAALAAYRRRHKLRSAQHPAASLLIEVGAVDTPFWQILPHGRRQTLRRRAGDPVLSAQECATLRPKALLLSAFARLVLADLFIHGIGGAKYDEVTEVFIRSCFGCEPGAMICVSATMHIHRCESAPSAHELAAAERRVRDFAYTPQAYIDSVPESLLQQRETVLSRMNEHRRRPRCSRDEWRQSVVPTLAALHRELRSVNERIVALAPHRHAELRADAERLRVRAAQAKIAADREAFFALHRLSELRALAATIHERFSGV